MPAATLPRPDLDGVFVTEIVSAVGPTVTAASETDSETGKLRFLQKIIQPGWGSSAYYPADVLAETGAAAFPAGTHLYWDHPTKTEEFDIPERTLTKLAGVTTEAAQWMEAGPEGAGLYAMCEVRSEYAGPVKEMQEWIGTSIRAYIAVEEGEAEGRRGDIATAMLVNEFNSVDFVTVPGAGGKIVRVFESAGRPAIEMPQPAAEGDKQAEEAYIQSQWVEARVHSMLTVFFDDLYGGGYLTKPNRIAMSGAVGKMLDVLAEVIDSEAADMKERRPWQQAPGPGELDEGDDGDSTSVEESSSTLPDMTAGEPNQEDGTMADTEVSTESGESTTTTTSEAGPDQAIIDRMNRSDARAHASEAVAELELPAPVRHKIREAALATIPTTEAGDVDFDKLDEQIEEARKAETEYLSEVTESGKITGMGGDAKPADESDEDLMDAYLERRGVNKAGREAAARRG